MHVRTSFSLSQVFFPFVPSPGHNYFSYVRRFGKRMEKAEMILDFDESDLYFGES